MVSSIFSNDVQMTDTRLPQFVSAFALEQNGYSAPTLFEGGEFGFSTLKEPDFEVKGVTLPDDGRLVTLIHIAIDEEDISSSESRKPIYSRLQFVREGQGRFFVDEALLKKIKNRPIDLISTDEYFYDFESQSFFRGRTKIEAHQILDELYSLHKKAAKNIRGLKLRSKILFQNLAASLLEGSASSLAYVHKVIYGEQVEYNPLLIAFREKTKTQSQTGEPKKEGKKLPLFGYDANFQLIVSYCVIHLVIYFVMFYFDWFPLMLLQIFTNNFLTVLYVISSLAFMEIVLKRILHKAVVALGSWSFSFSVRNIKL